jgi:hypothetical protein
MEFHFIARSTDTQKQTVRLFITKNDDSGYDWRMIYENGMGFDYVHLDNGEQVKARVKPMLRNLVWDSDTFETVGMHFPGFPSVLLNSKWADFPIDSIYQTVVQVLQNWPKMREATHVPTATDDLEDDDGDLSELEDEDEDDDMPPLIPINQSCSANPNDCVQCECWDAPRPQFMEPPHSPLNRRI